MMQLIQSQATAARRRIPVYLVDATDGITPETSITFSAGDIKVSKNGAAEGNHGGTVTELAAGMYYYEATAGELDTLGFLAMRFTKAGVRTFVALLQVIAAEQTGDSFARLGAPAGASVSADVAAVKAETAIIPTANQNADALLKRDWTAVTGEAARSVLNALRSLRNKVSISGGVVTIRKEDDIASAWTAAVITAPGDPISSVDPT